MLELTFRAGTPAELFDQMAGYVESWGGGFPATADAGTAAETATANSAAGETTTETTPARRTRGPNKRSRIDAPPPIQPPTTSETQMDTGSMTTVIPPAGFDPFAQTGAQAATQVASTEQAPDPFSAALAETKAPNPFEQSSEPSAGPNVTSLKERFSFAINSYPAEPTRKWFVQHMGLSPSILIGDIPALMDRMTEDAAAAILAKIPAPRAA